MRLNEKPRADHRLSNTYRFSAGLVGLALILFGLLGVTGRLVFFHTEGQVIAGLSTNGALSFLSVAFGSLLVGGAVLGGVFASTLNTVLGIGFIASGLVNLALLDTAYNLLAFRLPNVVFSFVVGLLLTTFGIYGRFTGGLPHDRAFWSARRQSEGSEGEARHSASPRDASDGG